ncbi:MAG TPA: hypothetical protein VFW86_05920 [Candidatus Limnocylindrales bacterium]|nr:hypothetical protein [Candidatus Limnocylindrales bacterium]
MDQIPIFVAGVVVGVVLTLGTFAIRRMSVADISGSSGAARLQVKQDPGTLDAFDSGAPDRVLAEMAAAADAAADNTAAGGGVGSTGPEPALEPFTDAEGRHGLHLTRRIVHRISTRLEPDGSLTITADGQTYRRPEDIPDAATREQVRAILTSLPNSVQDPKARDRVVAELQAAGIEPAPPARPVANDPSGIPSSGTSGGGAT